MQLCIAIPSVETMGTALTHFRESALEMFVAPKLRKAEQCIFWIPRTAGYLKGCNREVIKLVVSLAQH